MQKMTMQTKALDFSSGGGSTLAEVIPLDTSRTLQQLEHEWRELEKESDISFFSSWSWIGPWLMLARSNDVELYLYRCHRAEQLLALAILSRSPIKRRGIFCYQVLALHEVPAPGLDMIIEYNAPLIRRGHEPEIQQRFATDILQSPVKWDELRLSGIEEQRWHLITSITCALTPTIDEQRAPWATDISTVDNDLDKLLAPLSRNRRWQIRRSFKAFQEEGELKTSLPKSCDEALIYFEKMGALHTARWNSVGKAGSFANNLWVEFHRQVIREGFDRGEIQLLEISAGEKAIGYIYSFIWRGTAYMLQSGFSQEEDNVKRPGFVSHCMAMMFNSASGLKSYDYMCGDSDYKRTLACEQPALIWGRLQKRSLKWFLERLATDVVRRVRKARARTQPATAKPD